MQVLIVEDDPNLRILWEDVFEQAGHTTVTAETAAEAASALAQGRFDLVVLDYYLGEGDAGDVAGALDGSTPVLVVTGAAANCNGELFTLSRAISGVLRKPVDIEALIEVSEHLIAGAPDLSAERRRALALEVPSETRSA